LVKSDLEAASSILASARRFYHHVELSLENRVLDLRLFLPDLQIKGFVGGFGENLFCLLRRQSPQSFT